MPVKESLSIRSYSLNQQGHSHDFYQLVLPLSGVIDIELPGYQGKVKPGQCVVIELGVLHLFRAQTQAKFLVADLKRLPKHLLALPKPVIKISQALEHYLPFVEHQLESQLGDQVAVSMLALFYQLLEQQPLLCQSDERIQTSIDYIEQHLAEPINIEVLASVAHLSTTQFKKRFKAQTGHTVAQYIAHTRINKACALLRHTDYPIHVVANLVGYCDSSAFTRRFQAITAMTPSHFIGKRAQK
ncbi:MULTISPECIES: AraC family transcriptional regulator [unclassified Vibrio]|uniref:Helix-turn-helix domain-containing protein n=1 Tax=Vibrio sp. HB236076 TaxID=3232307 RepID=A0AB39HJM0_9VIBR|nr:AraC family transcriptional regulator [Vibrio sp. HB161653]MDP5254657.1 AraC family transcriptional regulator [Vibrio sp. HB161653]